MAKDKKKKNKKEKSVNYSVPDYAMTEKGLKAKIEQAIKAGGHLSMSEWAKETGVQPAGVSAFLRGTQPAGLKIPEVLGYKAQTVFIPINEEMISTAYPQRRPTSNPSRKTDPDKEPVEKKTVPKKTAVETKEELKAKLKGRHTKEKAKDKKKKNKK